MISSWFLLGFFGVILIGIIIAYVFRIKKFSGWDEK